MCAFASCTRDLLRNQRIWHPLIAAATLEQYIVENCEGCPLYIESLTKAILLSDLLYLGSSDEVYELEGESMLGMRAIESFTACPFPRGLRSISVDAGAAM